MARLICILAACAALGDAAESAAASEAEAAQVADAVGKGKGVTMVEAWENEVYDLVTLPHPTKPSAPRVPNPNPDVKQLKQILKDGTVHPDGYTDSGNKTALMQAAAAGSLDAVNILIGNGANVKRTTKNGATALIAAVGRKAGSAAEAKATRAIVKGLLKVGRDEHGSAKEYVNMKTKSGRNALVQAVNGGDIAVMRMLMEAGADSSGVSPHGDTMLIGACFKGDTALVDLVLDTKTSNPTWDLGARNVLGKTALHYAAEFNCLGCVQRLLKEEGGAALLAVKSYEWNYPNGAQTPLQYAVSAKTYYKNDAVVKVLQEAEKALASDAAAAENDDGSEL